MKYIDADLLRKDIDEFKNAMADCEGKYADGFRFALEHFTFLITHYSRQGQQEVDLEEITKFSRIKELPDGFDKYWLKYYHLDKEYNSVKFHHLSALEREYIIARHFYELGKNSKAAIKYCLENLV